MCVTNRFVGLFKLLGNIWCFGFALQIWQRWDFEYVVLLFRKYLRSVGFPHRVC